MKKEAIDQVLKWVKLGFHSFPGKVYYTTNASGEKKKAVVFPSDWQTPKAYPVEDYAKEDCNCWGLLTGSVNSKRDAHIVLDVDFEDLEALCAKYSIPKETLDTMCVRTPSNGYHFYYSYSAALSAKYDIRGSVKLTINGVKSPIDVRGTGSCVFGESSTIEDKAWVLQRDETTSKPHPVIPLPDFWIELITGMKPATPISPTAPIAGDYDIKDTDDNSIFKIADSDRSIKVYKKAFGKGVKYNQTVEYVCYCGLKLGKSKKEIFDHIYSYKKAKSIKKEDVDKLYLGERSKMLLTMQLEKKFDEKFPHLDGQLVEFSSNNTDIQLTASDVWDLECYGSGDNIKFVYAVDYTKLRNHMALNNVCWIHRQNNYELVKVSDGFIVDKLLDIKSLYQDYIWALREHGFLYDRSTYTGGDKPECFGNKLFSDIIKNKNFDEGKIGRLNSTVIKLDTDSEHEIKFYFKDLWVSITKDEYSFYEYGELKSHVLRSSIIPFNANDIAESNADHPMRCDFRDFVRNIAGSEDNFDAICSAIGYLLSRHKKPDQIKIIILCDDNPDPFCMGGTGKSLLIGALAHLRPIEFLRIDGKSFSETRQFAWQSLTTDTRIILLDDVQRTFNFEALYGSTNGFKYERKYQDEVIVPLEESPKICCTTNYSITGQGDSTKRRLTEYEISRHYNKDHQPVDDFGKQFFSGWDTKEWGSFYFFMIYCCQQYLEHGLVEQKVRRNLNYAKARDTSCTEWIDFCSNHIKMDSWYSTSEVLSRFESNYPDVGKRLKLSSRLIHSWAMAYANSEKINLFQDRISYKDHGRYHSIAFSKGTDPSLFKLEYAIMQDFTVPVGVEHLFVDKYNTTPLGTVSDADQVVTDGVIFKNDVD